MCVFCWILERLLRGRWPPRVPSAVVRVLLGRLPLPRRQLVTTTTPSTDLESPVRLRLDAGGLDQKFRIRLEVASQVTWIEDIGSRYHYTPVVFFMNYDLIFCGRMNYELSLFF